MKISSPYKKVQSGYWFQWRILKKLLTCHSVSPIILVPLPPQLRLWGAEPPQGGFAFSGKNNENDGVRRRVQYVLRLLAQNAIHLQPLWAKENIAKKNKLIPPKLQGAAQQRKRLLLNGETCRDSLQRVPAFQDWAEVQREF